MELPVMYDTLTPKERRAVRDQYRVIQNDNCFWCGFPLEGPPPTNIRNTPVILKMFPPGFLDHPIHLQHDHFTGLTEGAVHARCNAVMWQYHGR